MGPDDKIASETPGAGAPDAPAAATSSLESDGKTAQADQPSPASAEPGAAEPKADAAASEGFPETLLDKAGAPKEADATKTEGESGEKVEDKPAAEAKAEDKPEAKEGEKPEDGKDAAAKEEPEADAAPKLDPIDYFAEDGGIAIPDALKLDDASRGELTAALDAFRADPRKGAQALIDLHAKQMAAHDEFVKAEQWRVFRETGAEWARQAMADPVIGGAGHDTAMRRVAAARDLIVSNAKPGTPQYEADLAAFNEMARVTGVGNHPAFLRMLHNAGRYVREADLPPPDPAPPKDAGKDPRRAGRRLSYDNTTYDR